MMIRQSAITRHFHSITDLANWLPTRAIMANHLRIKEKLTQEGDSAKKNIITIVMEQLSKPNPAQVIVRTETTIARIITIT